MKPLALVTGATSGIGQLTAERLIRKRPDLCVITSGPDEADRDSIPGHDFIAADLSSLNGARQLAASLLARNASVDLLVLAAGRQHRDDLGRSSDGFELTFAVNTLANVVLLDALIAGDRLPKRVLWFSSGTHDPAKKAGLPTPRHADAHLLARPERDEAALKDKPSTRGARAYTSSKLAVAMLVYAYAREQPNLRIDAFDPQLTPGTGLARYQSRLIQAVWHKVLPLIVPLVPFMNRPDAVAHAAVAIALEEVLPAGNGRYIEVRRGRPVEGRSSLLSYNGPAQERLLADIRELIAT